jgi:hypothetical protein
MTQTLDQSRNLSNFFLRDGLVFLGLPKYDVLTKIHPAEPAGRVDLFKYGAGNSGWLAKHLSLLVRTNPQIKSSGFKVCTSIN